ncbi:MAG: hypothetical protein OCD02_08395 [Spirochaetaceae bacterium]
MNEQKENPFLNLLFNIIVPSFILMKLSDIEYLGSTKSLILALLFPLVFGLYSLIKNKKVNFFSVVGLVSIILTGSFSLLALDVKWIVMKEAGIPFLFGLFVIISLKTPFPVVKKLLLNDQILNMDIISIKLLETNNTSKFDKCITISTFMLSASFFISSFLNSFLAIKLLKSQPGSSAFNEELGLMTAYSFPVIAVPSMIILVLIFAYIFRSLKFLTGLKSNEILADVLVK